MSTVTIKRSGNTMIIGDRPQLIVDLKNQKNFIDINGKKAVQMLCYFGSSTYDTKEFTHLLDGIISEMKEMGLETPTTADMRRSLELWGKMHEKTA